MAGRSTQLVRLCTDEATVWTPAAPNGFGGSTFSAGRLVMVKWVGKQQKVMVQGGREMLSVASFIATETVTVGSWIALGNPESLDSSVLADPMAVAGSYEVLSSESAHALSGDRTIAVYAVGKE